MEDSGGSCLSAVCYIRSAVSRHKYHGFLPVAIVQPVNALEP